LVWLNFPTAYSFLIISPNLHAIWVFFLLNLSQEFWDLGRWLFIEGQYKIAFAAQC
jgi:hypothetical protein